MTYRKSLSWLGTAQVISFLLQFAFSVVMARYLTPYEMGIFAVATALVGMLSIIQQVSLPALIVREHDITEDFTRTAFTVNVALSLLLSLAIVGASVLGAAALRAPGVQDVLLVLAATPLFGIFSFLPMAHMERDGRFKELALISTASSITNALVGVGLVVAGFSYMSIAYAQVASSAVLTMLSVWAGRNHVQYRFGLHSWRRILEFSMQMLAVAGVHGFSQRFSELIIGRLLGLSMLGLYNRASGINSLFWSNINSIAGRIVLVDFSSAYRKGTSLRKRYLWTVSVVTAILWPAFAGLAVVAKPFIVIIYGERWVAAVIPFVFLALTSILLSSITMTWELFTTTGRLREQTRLEGIRAAVGIVLFTIGCTISLEAAAASRALEAIFAIWLYRPYLDSMTETSKKDFRRIYLESGLLTLLAIAPAGILMWIEEATIPPLLLLGGAIGTGMILWVVGLALLRHPLMHELRLMASLARRYLRPVQAHS